MWNSIVRHTDTCVFNFTTNCTMRFGQRYTNQFTTWRIANCVYQLRYLSWSKTLMMLEHIKSIFPLLKQTRAMIKLLFPIMVTSLDKGTQPFVVCDG